MTDFAAARRNMVDGQIRTADVTDLRLLWAFQDTPRERFVPPQSTALAYVDFDLPVAPRRGLIKPRLLAKMLQIADIAPTDRVLDVGTATGYGAAVLARVAAQVVALEEDAELAGAARGALSGVTNVQVVSGALAAGWAAESPYDVIVVEGATEVVPETLAAPVERRRPAGLCARRRSGGQGHALSAKRRRRRRPRGIRRRRPGAAGLRQATRLRLLRLHTRSCIVAKMPRRGIYLQAREGEGVSSPSSAHYHSCSLRPTTVGATFAIRDVRRSQVGYVASGWET